MGGGNKLANRWEDDVYLVLRKAGKLPVYTVKPEAKERPVRTLHRDLLLPCSFIPITESTENSSRKPNARRNTRQTVVREDDDSESEYLPGYPCPFPTLPSHLKCHQLLLCPVLKVCKDRFQLMMKPNVSSQSNKTI